MTGPPRWLQWAVWIIGLGYPLLMGIWMLLLPAAGLVGLSLLGVAGAAGFWLVWRRGVNRLLTPLDRGILTLVVAAGLAAVFSIDPSRSWRIVWLWLAGALVFYLAVVVFRCGWSPRLFSAALYVLVAVLLISAYIQLFLYLRPWYQTMGWTRPLPPEMLRVWGFSDNPNILASLISAPLLLGINQVVHGDRANYLLWLWLALALPIFILTGSRGGWLGAAAGLLTLRLGSLSLHFRDKALSRRVWWRFGATATVTIVSLLALTAWLRPQSFWLNRAQLAQAFDRVILWPVALTAWRQHPWLGAGPNTYLTYYLQEVAVPPAPPNASPHNVVLSVLGQMGLVGLAAFLYGLALWWRWLRREWRNGRWSNGRVGLTAALTSLGVHSLFDAFELRPQPMILGAVLLAALVGGKKQVAGGRWQVASGNSYLPPATRYLLPVTWLFLYVVVMVGGVWGWQVDQRYADGLAAVEASDWSAAVDHFAAAQTLSPYPDTALLLGQSFALGIEATADTSQLQPAVAAYEQVIRAESGWSLNHANLAALYWQQGRAAEAIATMQQAITLSPAVPFYYLNLGLWYEAQGVTEAAQTAYAELYRLETTWRESPFWRGTTARRAAATIPLTPANQPDEATRLVAEGRAALALGQRVLAADLFHQSLAIDPDQPGGHLGLGVIYFQSGRSDLAADAWQRATALDRASHLLTLDGTPYQQSIALWQSLLPEADPAETQSILARLTRPSVTGYGRPAGNYLFMAFVRLPMAAEILPQLRCLPVSADLAWHLNQLQTWYTGQGETENAQAIEAILQGDEDGLTSCGVQL
ncbi:MAG: O-antigen ligase family protein [Chloroflexota bacterium]